MLDLTHKTKTLVRLLRAPLEETQERIRKGALYQPRHNNFEPQTHIREAAEWLVRAQDAGADRGVSYGADFGNGFLPSYPETTGYIIPTFLALCRYLKRDEFRSRAVEMGEWESAVQLESGAVMGGMYNRQPTPAIFNTGMVLLGWSALYDETGCELFRCSGARAARWLMEMQDEDGTWRRGNSQFARAESTLYNVKAAWGLARMGRSLGQCEYLQAAVRNAEFTVSQQHPNGWFPDCCLTNPHRPLLHTIAYTMQGLIGIGTLSKRREFIDAAEKTARSLAGVMHPDGFIPGAIESNFRGTVNWACLTGTAQTSIVWSALEKLTGDAAFGQAAERANRYLMARHDIANADPALRGGVAGSWPVSAEYGRYKVLNWATKFLVDALLLREPNAADLFCLLT
ncbi:MAG TPA: hypothetical protein VKX25_22615 [Bryobacteraceae bacterium]|jgi:hypothetical protein|nr:hypothetical protein [Bryobacteraceae bacterium]